MWVSAGMTEEEMAWRRWVGIGSSGQVVGWLERMSLETSVSERGEKEVRDCVFVVMKLLLVCGVRNWFCKSILRVQKNTPNNACRAELGQYPLLMHIEKWAIKFWKHLKMSDPNSYHFKALKNHEVNLEKSPLIQMFLKLQTQTKMTNNIQHQDTEILIHKIRPNQIIKTQKENYLTYWKETTEKQSKLECYLALNRDYTTAEYLSTVKDCKLRRQMTRYRLSNHTLTIETGRYRQHWLPKESRICPPVLGKVTFKSNALQYCVTP